MENVFYHIRIEVERNNELIIETDIEESDLIQRIIRPWETQGNDSFYCGKSFIQKYQVSHDLLIDHHQLLLYERELLLISIIFIAVSEMIKL